MKLIVGPRQAGKTWNLTQWALEAPEQRVILVANMERREAIFVAAKLQGAGRRDLLARPWVWPVSSFRELAAGRAATLEVAVDDLDDVLCVLFGDVVLASGSLEVQRLSGDEGE